MLQVIISVITDGLPQLDQYNHDGKHIIRPTIVTDSYASPLRYLPNLSGRQNVCDDIAIVVFTAMNYRSSGEIGSALFRVCS